MNNNVDQKPHILPQEVEPPCKAACPVFTDAQRYVSLVSRQRYSEALEYIMENNPLPGSIGRICVHPCETACRRGEIDEPIAICALKRFVVDQVGSDFKPQRVAAVTGKKVVVIGSGPSGLAAALDLARAGHTVTILEKQASAGGMLRSGILSYRLPRDVLDRDIQNILAVGIELQTEVAVGRDVAFLDLLDSYDAVLVAVGLSVSRGLPIPGADLPGVHYALPFLESVNYGRPETLGKDIIVIGGGNVAVDVARSARRLGDNQVKMVCLEARHEMPAHDYEIEAAMAEGVEIHCSFGPHQIVDKNGRVGGLEFKEVDCVFDEEGRFNPKFHDDRRTIIPGDTVIFAIGQGSELDFLSDSGVALNDRGQLVFNPSTMATSLPGVFATGEVSRGPGAAIQAIASGHQAADAIDKYLDTGKIVPVPGAEPRPVDAVPDETKSFIKTGKRQKMPERDPRERVADFSEVDLGLSVDAAVREAQRCLLCTAGAAVDADKCVACLTCVRVCPYAVPVIDGAVAYMDPAKCQSCGICSAECPAQAISVRVSDEHRTTERLRTIGRRFAGVTETKAIGFICQYGQMWAAERLWNMGELPPNTEIIDIMCLGRLPANELLAAFETGADKVFVMPCLEGNCRNTTGNTFAGQRVAYIKDILAGAGLDPEALQLLPIGFGTSISATAKSVAVRSLEG